MKEVSRGCSGERLSIAIGVFLLALAIAAAAPASSAAAERIITGESLVIRLTDRVYSESCDPCHGNIADTDNYDGTIYFEHGYHMLIQCSSCHSVFPHRPEGTIKPDMKLCFDCHGLYHGPMGSIASGECETCHIAPRDQLRPDFHIANWAQEPHVQPAEERLQTQCMMCHDRRSCTDCHDDLGIEWEPDVPYTYDSADGCLTCHGDPYLLRASEGRLKSYQVTGIENSVHRDLTCQQCHTDFTYEDRLDPSPLWRVNAGLACRECHMSPENFEEGRGLAMAAIVAEYDASIHAQALRDRIAGRQQPGVQMEPLVEPPTCAGCHGGHYIRRLDTAQAREALHLAGYRMCGRCHQAEYDSYDDPYHGAVYKRGALDAPSCWDCHAAHAVLPNEDPLSLMSDANMPATCGTQGCHYGSAEPFTAAAADLIHGKAQARAENPIQNALERVREWLP